MSRVPDSTRPVSANRLLTPTLPPPLQGLAGTVAGRLGPALRGGSVYTDDRAPVEWLTDLSLLRYATGQR